MQSHKSVIKHSLSRSEGKSKWVQNKEGKGKVIQPRGYREPINLCYTEYINQSSKLQTTEFKINVMEIQRGKTFKEMEWKV